MILLRLISWPYLRKHLLRSLLTTAGIALGIALLVGMRTANDSVGRAFSDTVDRIAGKAQLQVSAGDAGFNEDVLERVQSVPERAEPSQQPVSGQSVPEADQRRRGPRARAALARWLRG